MRDASKPRSNAAAIRLRADSANLDPVVIEPGIATQELRIVVDRVHYNINVPVIVEVAEGATAARRGVRNSWSNLQGDVGEMAVAQVAIKQLALRITCLSF